MSETSLKRSDNELIVERIIDAPPELVFLVWTDPTHVVKWWGPTGFSTTNIGMSIRPGGEWRFIMHGPDGRDYTNKIVFTEVVENEKLVYHHSGDEDTDPISFHVTVTFEKKGKQTLLTMRSVFTAKADLDHVAREHGAIEGAYQHIERLAEYVTAL